MFLIYKNRLRNQIPDDYVVLSIGPVQDVAVAVFDHLLFALASCTTALMAAVTVTLCHLARCADPAFPSYYRSFVAHNHATETKAASTKAEVSQ
ncbi:hypothetical protein KEM54_002126, partial [Ascosphaera aggregata]